MNILNIIYIDCLMLRFGAFVSLLSSLFFSPVLSAQQDVMLVRSATRVSRVVALTSLTADMVVTLNPDVLVGIPGTSLTNADPRFDGIQRVSSGRSQPSVEAIVALNPDLVLGADGFHSNVLDSLNRLGISSLSLKIDRWSRLEEAARLLREKIPNSNVLERKLSSICPASSVSVKGASSRVLILVGVSPMLSPASKSWSGSLLARHGLINATQGRSGGSEFPGYITMSKEKLLTIDADSVLAVDPAGGAESLRVTLGNYLPHVNEGGFYKASYYGLINPGSLNSIASACQQLRTLKR